MITGCREDVWAGDKAVISDPFQVIYKEGSVQVCEESEYVWNVERYDEGKGGMYECIDR